MAWWGGAIIALAIVIGLIALGVSMIREGLTSYGDQWLAAIGALILVFTLGGVMVIWGEVRSAAHAQTVTLRLDYWACTDDHDAVTTTYVLAGKVMVPVTSHSRVCDQWSGR